MFKLKKYRGVIFHDTRRDTKLEKKTDLWFGQCHDKFGKYSPKQTSLKSKVENV